MPVNAAAKPQNTVQADTSVAKLWKVGTAWPLVPLFTAPFMLLGKLSLTHIQSCRDTVSRRPTLMATSCLRPEFSMWLVNEAVQQSGARYSFSSVG